MLVSSPRARVTAFLTVLIATTFNAASRGSCQPTEPRLEVINGYKVLHVAGSPEDMGRQHGRLLRTEVRRMVDDLIIEQRESDYGLSGYDRLIAGARVMDQYIPTPFRRELMALAEEADVDYFDLVAAQLHGDVDRADMDGPSRFSSPYCSSYAVFGPATMDGSCMVGRNFDFSDNGIMKYGAVIIHFRPDEGIPHVSMTWAGIINGWTLMNADGIVTANNTAYGRKDSLEGISTCFMLRTIAQFAHTVEEGVHIIEQGPRACGTNIIIAGGSPVNAAVVEFDHDQLAVRWAERGEVCADNSFYKLYKTEPKPFVDPFEGEPLPRPGGLYGGPSYPGSSYSPSSSYSYRSSRYTLLEKAIEKHYGAIDESMNFAGLEGVPMGSLNLHSAMLYPSRLAFAVTMGDPPAYKNAYRRFRMTPEGVVSDEVDGRRALMAWKEPDERPVEGLRTR